MSTHTVGQTAVAQAWLSVPGLPRPREGLAAESQQGLGRLLCMKAGWLVHRYPRVIDMLLSDGCFTCRKSFTGTTSLVL